MIKTMCNRLFITELVDFGELIVRLVFNDRTNGTLMSAATSFEAKNRDLKLPLDQMHEG